MTQETLWCENYGVMFPDTNAQFVKKKTKKKTLTIPKGLKSQMYSGNNE